MSDLDDRSAAELRQVSQKRLRERLAELPVGEAQPTDALVHELRVHQIELEMQNDELRRLQLDLQASRSRYFELYDLAPVGYLTLNQAGLVDRANLICGTMLGLARAAVIHQPFGRFLARDGMDAFYLTRRRVLTHDDQESVELRMLRLDGVEFWAHLVLQAALEDGVRVIRVVLTDVTQRKKAEEAKALLEEQLRQAQKLESVGRLAGGVAHDFNNMLTVILNNAEEALARTEPAAPERTALLEIKDAGQRSASLIRQLLAFARKQIIAPVAMNLNEQVGGMLGMLKRLLREDLELRFTPADGLWPIKMDPSQLDQVLANLCINARDAIQGVGTISIELANAVVTPEDCRLRPSARPGEFVRLTITDTGSGIAAAALPLIFEPFFTTKGPGKGTGLGLATVYGAVTQNHGFIEVTSQLGHGAAFLLFFPRQQARPVEAGNDAEPRLRDGKETILLVEDEPAISRVTSRVLRAQGYTVLTASSPEEALVLARTHPGEIDLLLTDVIMPNMNGRKLSGAVAVLRPQIKCLFMSGYTADVLDEHGLRGDRFLQKPFSSAELATKVRAALG
jgi:two-component system cell cycle sensor histidine kinase/response regulator CckA